ncbi:MAG: nucleotidyltransferase domain-containing protein [Bacteroidales bacterium]|nr:nucleotidyltransferase domain-containing protein [Bacteroidales bacterium]
MFSSLQNYLSSIPVIRAWVFGSFARGEETAESDLDLLVDYDKSEKISLFDIVGYKLEMEKIAGREVDLVENGFLKSFAVPSAEKDKYLIYEKQS